VTIEVGDTVKLTARKKGGPAKNVLIIFGDLMVVERIKDSVLFSPKPGPWLLVTCDVGSGHCRWINVEDDRLFTVEKVNG